MCLCCWLGDAGVALLGSIGEVGGDRLLAAGG